MQGITKRCSSAFACLDLMLGDGIPSSCVVDFFQQLDRRFVFMQDADPQKLLSYYTTTSLACRGKRCGKATEISIAAIILFSLHFFCNRSRSQEPRLQKYCQLACPLNTARFHRSDYARIGSRSLAHHVRGRQPGD